MATTLLYLEDAAQLSFQATLVAVRDIDGRTALVVDQTHFYPQGGGQPADRGVIAGPGGAFTVTDTRFVDGEVLHYGTFAEGHLEVGAAVEGRIDAERRALHARLHSAGHVLDLAVRSIGLTWEPTKGYHFPEGPYVEYHGSLDDIDRTALAASLADACARIVAADAPVTVRFMPREEMTTVCAHVPTDLPPGKPARVVLFGTDGTPCGGTHVAHLGMIGAITIRKVKAEGTGSVRIGYDVAH